MLATNLVLLFALVVMVGIAIWLFNDGEGAGPAPPIRPLDTDNDETKQPRDHQPQVRVVANSEESMRTAPVKKGRDV